MKLGNKIAIICAFVAMACQAQISFNGNSKAVVDEVPPRSTGLDHVFVLKNLTGVSMTYPGSGTDLVKWYRFGEQGAAYATEITSGITQSGATSTLSGVENCGYAIEQNGTFTYVWVIDYSSCELILNDITTDEGSDCNTATITVSGSGRDLEFYTITGVRNTLDRQMKLQYTNLVWNDELTQWVETDTVEYEHSFKPTIVLPAPYCNTTFTLSGDKYLEAWDEEVAVTSGTYVTKAVNVMTKAVQQSRNNDNERGSQEESSTLGGSAPVDITFTAYCTDAIIHYEWQMALDQDFDDIQLRLNQEEVSQNFTEAGTFYWRFIGSNSDGSCEAYSETYTVSIGTSDLLCPNVFSPGSSEGVNDVWKVSYRSIVDFHCWIYNRWGIQVAEFTDPGQGWDGRYNGKIVGSGVYFYVIKARGSDGKNYKLSGDINVIRAGKLGNGGDGGGLDYPIVDPNERQ